MRFAAQMLVLAAMMPGFGGNISFAQPSGACKLVSERTGELGCWIIAHDPLGTFAETETYWHLDTFSSRAEAEASKGSRGTVVESMGKVWLFTIEARGLAADQRRACYRSRPAPYCPEGQLLGTIYGGHFQAGDDIRDPRP
jgi:hypothetical protein